MSFVSFFWEKISPKSRVYIRQFNELIIEAEYSPEGVRGNLLDNAIKIVDANNDVKRGFQGREKLLEHVVFSGHSLRALEIFPWMVSEYDKNTSLTSSLYMHWYFKWIAGNLSDSAEISWAQIKEFWDDFEGRLKESSYSLRPLYKIKSTAYSDMGLFKDAEVFLRLWEKATIDDLSDCHAWSCQSAQEYILY